MEYNVELNRLRQLTRSVAENSQQWREEKNAIVQGAARNVARPTWVELAKKLVNVAGNSLDMGDEIIAFAEKPL